MLPFGVIFKDLWGQVVVVDKDISKNFFKMFFNLKIVSMTYWIYLTVGNSLLCFTFFLFYQLWTLITFINMTILALYFTTNMTEQHLTQTVKIILFCNLSKITIRQLILSSTATPQTNSFGIVFLFLFGEFVKTYECMSI